MKKVVYIALAMMLSMWALVSCGNDKTQVSSVAPVNESQIQQVESAQEETTPEPTATVTTTVVAKPSNNEFVCVSDYIPSAVIDLKYAESDNFIGERIYDSKVAYLRYGTVKKLMKANEELSALGYSLKIWDAFRPYSAQCKMWEIYPDPTYVSNPETGRLSHCRGNAVDVTLVTNDGSEVKMPTEFDDFTPLADRDYSDVSKESASNAELLEECMERCGFSGYTSEWWHFSDSDDYPIEKEFNPK